MRIDNFRGRYMVEPVDRINKSNNNNSNGNNKSKKQQFNQNDGSQKSFQDVLNDIKNKNDK